MADAIICSVCGETNPPDMEFCRNCQSRLQPLTGPLRAENAPIRPGDTPTKKVTSELEPVLPQWLRKARQQARESAEDETSRVEPAAKEKPAVPAPDLLAGLDSQKPDEEDETPDWLAEITGTRSKKKKASPEEPLIKWVELGHKEKTREAPPSDEERAALPWMTQQPPASSEKDELTDWLKQASGAAPATATGPVQPEVPKQELTQPPVEGLPPPAEQEDLSWLRNLDTEAAAGVAATGQGASPEWLKDRQSEGQSTPAPGDATGQPPAATEMPDWLKNLGEAVPPSTSIPPPAIPAIDEALPDWLRPASTPSPAAPFSSSTEPTDDQSQAAPAILPDWISALKPEEAEAANLSDRDGAALPPEDATTEEPAAGTSAFTPDAMPAEDVDSVFGSMQVPDWLSGVAPSTSSGPESRPPAATAEEPIAPADLPSWVQAMRPLESAMPVSSTSTSGPSETILEEVGALAGLQGVLPAVPGSVEPSSKPKAHSLRLDATDQQQAQAALLEGILAAETSPVAMKTGALLKTQRGLRWLISVLLLVLLGGTVLAKSQTLPMPSLAPNETNRAVQSVEAVPPDAPVLVVFDYQPATIGEMEATGSSLLDHLLLLKHPHLAVLSTSPTGAALADRFMSSAVADRLYVRGVQYVNLGYLPGGLAGVYDFAQNPRTVVPLDADGNQVWQSAALGGVTSYSDFAAVILLTDSAETGRTWVEQTASARGNGSLIIVSSAQAGPMLLPYADSGQINGLVAGVIGAAGAEQANGGLPGQVRRYWDAYSLGLYLAVLLVTAGGLWNFWLGIHDRRNQAAG